MRTCPGFPDNPEAFLDVEKLPLGATTSPFAAELRSGSQRDLNENFQRVWKPQFRQYARVPSTSGPGSEGEIGRADGGGVWGVLNTWRPIFVLVFK